MATPTSGPDRAGRPYDLILFGATSFVGRLVADYVARHAPARTTVAIAGRDEHKLHDLRAGLPGAAGTWGVLVADADDTGDMHRLAESARVVLTTVGPYHLHGRHLVRACAAAGTDYLDLAGEVLFVRDSVLELHELAQTTGARIIHSCGFDSVPSDLAAYRLFREHGRLGDTEMVISDLVGGLSGGTVSSMLSSYDALGALAPEERAAAKSPFALAPGMTSEKKLRATGVKPGLAPFFMAGYNTRLVQRSAFLLGYGPEFTYAEYHRVGGKAKTAAYTAVLATVGKLLDTSLGRRLLARVLAKPGEGPSPSQRAQGRFTVDTGDVRVALDMDPGYDGTALMIAEGAFTLLAQPDTRTGVLTPAAGLGDAYVTRLRAAGMTIT